MSMKEKRIMDILGDVDDQYVNEAASESIRKNRRGWIKYGVLAAGFCIAVGVIGMKHFATPEGRVDDSDINARASSSEENAYVVDGSDRETHSGGETEVHTAEVSTDGSMESGDAVEVKESLIMADWLVYTDIREAVFTADSVLIGTVTDVSVEMMTFGGDSWPYEICTMEIEQVIKGTIESKTIRIKTMALSYETTDKNGEAVRYVIACGSDSYPKWQVGEQYFIAADGPDSKGLHWLISIEGGWALYDQKKEAVLWNEEERYSLDEIRDFLQ